MSKVSLRGEPKITCWPLLPEKDVSLISGQEQFAVPAAQPARHGGYCTCAQTTSFHSGGSKDSLRAPCRKVSTFRLQISFTKPSMLSSLCLINCKLWFRSPRIAIRGLGFPTAETTTQHRGRSFLRGEKEAFETLQPG